MTDTPSIPPALTAEEWTAERVTEGYPRREDVAQCSAVGFWVDRDRDLVFGIEYEGLDRDDVVARRHALAALCLYEQSFGFTQEDVELLRKAWHADDCGALYTLYDHDCQCAVQPAHAQFRALADRIAALLPPK